MCGAERLGHGVRHRRRHHRPGRRPRDARPARRHIVRDRRVPLEMCPTSNVHTGVATTIEEHPIGLLRRLRFRVTVNTDNRLMSGITMSSEFGALVDAFGIGLDEIEWLTLNAMKSAFWPFDEPPANHQRADQAGLRTPPGRPGGGRAHRSVTRAPV